MGKCGTLGLLDLWEEQMAVHLSQSSASFQLIPSLKLVLCQVIINSPVALLDEQF